MAATMVILLPLQASHLMSGRVNKIDEAICQWEQQPVKDLAFKSSGPNMRLLVPDLTTWAFAGTVLECSTALSSLHPLSMQAASSATIPPLTLQKARQLIPVAGERFSRLVLAAVYLLERTALRRLAVCVHGCCSLVQVSTVPM